MGNLKLTLTAELNGSARRSDTVIREIEVVPNGREQNAAFNGRLDTTARQEMNFPPAAIPDARTESGEQAWWNVEETGVFATGKSAAVETTGLAVQALLKWGEAASVTRKAINYITANKDASGTWATTQATIMALRALLLSTETGGDAKGSLEVLCNGKIVGQLELSEANNDLLHQFVVKGTDAQAANIVELRFRGQGTVAYQVAGRYFPALGSEGGRRSAIDRPKW